MFLSDWAALNNMWHVSGNGTREYAFSSGSGGFRESDPKDWRWQLICWKPGLTWWILNIVIVLRGLLQHFKAPKCVCPVRHRLTVQSGSIPSPPQRHLQPHQLESPSHAANTNGWRPAIGSDGVTWSGSQAQPRVRGNTLNRWPFR